MSAPLAGVTDHAYLRILHELGTPLMFSEMYPSDSLIRKPTRALKKLRLQPDLNPLCVQLFGHKASNMAEAARVVWNEGAYMVDINMGCPAKKVVKSGNGAALMDNPKLAFAIMEAVRQAVDCPVSIKLRLGLDPAHPVALEYTRHAEQCGLDFVIVHGRFRENYSMPADWNAIKQIKSQVAIPVVGNGDILSSESARTRLVESGCDAVMTGRGILGNPWLPGHIAQYLETGKSPVPVTLRERLSVMIRHLHYLEQIMPPRHAPIVFRKHAAWYFKGIPHIVHLKKQLYHFTKISQYEAIARKLIIESFAIAGR